MLGVGADVAHCVERYSKQGGVGGELDCDRLFALFESLCTVVSIHYVLNAVVIFFHTYYERGIWVLLHFGRQNIKK